MMHDPFSKVASQLHGNGHGNGPLPIGTDPQQPGMEIAYSYQQYQRQRTMTLGDLLLENRIVFLQGEIHTGNANELVMKLLYLQSENRKKDIHFYLNSM